MLNVELKPLIQKLNTVSTSNLEAAVGLCMNQSHYEITIEHWLFKLMEDKSCDIYHILNALNINTEDFKQILIKNLDAMESGNSAKPSFSLSLLELVESAWVIASINYQLAEIRSGFLILALLNNRPLLSSLNLTDIFANTSRNELLKNYYDLCGSSPETATVIGEKSSTSAASNKIQHKDSALANFCEDLTEKAKTGKIDPVFGREDEIEQMLDIFCRRRKNNPILVGEPGVGKTAVVEGLALRIMRGDVPEILQNVKILSLDMALLEAGASVKGEFEKRLTQVIDEVKASEIPIILFIDEAHRLIGGANQGGNDAANILKPALSRGELRTVAATTWKEYKQYFEKDAAMTRRFQLVSLAEPNLETTTLILRGLKEHYAKSHQVTIRDDAIKAIVELSSRYITGRYQPDKSVDLLDTCAAKVKVNLSSKPHEINHIERTIAALQREEKALYADELCGNDIDKERQEEIVQKKIQLETSKTHLANRWQQEKDLIDQLLFIQSRLLNPDASPINSHQSNASENEPLEDKNSQSSTTDSDIQSPDYITEYANLTQTELKHKRDELKTQLKTIQQEDFLISYEVDPDCVAKVVSNWTGIPLGKVLRDQASSLLMLEDNLIKRIKGQDEGIKRISTYLKLAKAGLSQPEQPMGIFLLVGPSGVGKTETALTIADTIFGGEESIISINMSEFQEKHTISRLIGSPPGYVGFGEGGMLTEAVRKRPYTVVLLDEVEKASLDVLNLFYQVFDKGSLTDGEGREIDFSNTVMILTSNLATNEITELTQKDPNISQDEIINQIRPILSQWFKPALLARTTIIPYAILSEDALAEIVALKLSKLKDRLFQQNAINFNYSDKVLQQIAQRCTEHETGARNVDHILKSNVMPKLSDVILESMCDEQVLESITLDIDQNGQFTFKVNQEVSTTIPQSEPVSDKLQQSQRPH
ncbi:MAG: type VI secretion system ATPase TssH [Gammaproteobacteria bacterium]|nr:MAG: type VI secretion system ATPase TssH [Gammaproteobacteria bacterium]UTW42697.1 type VI secretion system ATPase TssH [bacterium SCSIO 12844]